MVQWGNTDDAANSVLWGVSNHSKEANTVNQTAFFGNTTVGAFQNGSEEAVGQFGVDVVEMGVTDGPAHAGWVERTEGVGELSEVTVSSGGADFDTGDTIEVVADSGANAEGTVTIAANVITAITLTDTGGLFKAGPTINITTGAGTGATLVGVVGGKAGRVSYETLVAMGSMTGDASDDTEFPDS